MQLYNYIQLYILDTKIRLLCVGHLAWRITFPCFWEAAILIFKMAANNKFLIWSLNFPPNIKYWFYDHYHTYLMPEIGIIFIGRYLAAILKYVNFEYEVLILCNVSWSQWIQHVLKPFFAKFHGLCSIFSCWAFFIAYPLR